VALPVYRDRGEDFEPGVILLKVARIYESATVKRIFLLTCDDRRAI
jgi:hypothetical protein